jgi:hypothetical protein
MEQQPIDNKAVLKDGFNFTPIYKNVRVRMKISRADHAKLGRGPGMYGIVTDQQDGKRYKVYGRSCGLPRCMCDAEIKDVA